MIRKPKIFSSSEEDLVAEIRNSRGQSQSVPKSETPKRKKSGGGSYYDNFYRKYVDLENTIDTLGTRDLVYFFREVAEEHGQKYVISNIQKDMAIMKRLLINYTTREICGMIEFLYDSEQDYLDKSRLSINLLASQWINTIYADMQLWVDDKYISKSKQNNRKKALKQREWNSDKEDDNKSSVKIGVKF